MQILQIFPGDTPVWLFWFLVGFVVAVKREQIRNMFAVVRLVATKERMVNENQTEAWALILRAVWWSVLLGVTSFTTVLLYAFLLGNIEFCQYFVSKLEYLLPLSALISALVGVMMLLRELTVSGVNNKIRYFRKMFHYINPVCLPYYVVVWFGMGFVDIYRELQTPQSKASHLEQK